MSPLLFGAPKSHLRSKLTFSHLNLYLIKTLDLERLLADGIIKERRWKSFQVCSPSQIKYFYIFSPTSQNLSVIGKDL